MNAPNTSGWKPEIDATSWLITEVTQDLADTAILTRCGLKLWWNERRRQPHETQGLIKKLRPK